ncbi:MAG: AAA family ATPase, partial [Defluviitaleaceae bacterium]|nr:AAA family ATPase [Defluviitaleaceae bacterium]
MLEYLKVQNVALIEETEVRFGSGLNILTGETGAGKSILIDSINFVLGGRACKDFVRSGAQNAEVSALFATGDEEILLSRTYNTSGKSVSKIDGKTVTVGMLREEATRLLDVHGQHEHQSLLDSSKHLLLLDRFCKNELD